MECLPHVSTAMVDSGMDTLDLEENSVYEEHPVTHSTVYVGHEMTGILSKCKLAKPRKGKAFAAKTPNVFSMKIKSDQMSKLEGDKSVRYSIDETKMLSPDRQTFLDRQSFGDHVELKNPVTNKVFIRAPFEKADQHIRHISHLVEQQEELFSLQASNENVS